MNSLNYCGTVLSNIIKASQAAKSSAELVVDLESQVAQFFNAAQQEVEELEKQAQTDKDRIAELEKQAQTDKDRITELEAEVEPLKSKIPAPVDPEVM